MKQHKLKFFIVTLSLSATVNAWALFCPTSLNQMNIGDTAKQVETQCGKPDAQRTYKPEPKVPQEWTYYQSPSTNPYTSSGSPSITSSQSNQTIQGSLKTTFAFDQNGKLVNITVGNASITSTNICNGAAVQIGSSTKDVETACGKASYVNRGIAQDSGGNAPVPEMTEWTYQGPPKVILVFENGVLKERK